MCQGKQSCTVHASNSNFGDPCSGTAKYLDVSLAEYDAEYLFTLPLPPQGDLATGGVWAESWVKLTKVIVRKLWKDVNYARQKEMLNF